MIPNGANLAMLETNVDRFVRMLTGGELIDQTATGRLAGDRFTPISVATGEAR